MTGVEALLRWRHPTLGLLGPDQFVGLTEETGAIVPLGRWVLATACAQAQSWRAEFGGESHWSLELGREVAARGAEALWPHLTSR